MSDNISPFRRPKPKRPQQEGGFGIKTHRGKVVLGHILTIVAFSLNFAFRFPPWSFIGLAVAIAAVFIVYSNRGAAMPWANTHHEHALRTLVIGYALWIFADLLMLIHGSLGTVTIFLQLGIAIWAVLRAVVALVLGVMRKAVPRPRGWFI
jgi:uncharacterized membrane protein